MNKMEGIYMLCYFLGLAITLNANIGEFDEYWQKRKLEVVKYFEEAYHSHPYNVTHHFNQQVHLWVILIIIYYLYFFNSSVVFFLHKKDMVNVLYDRLNACTLHNRSIY